LQENEKANAPVATRAN